MNTITKLASVTLVALMLGTSLAVAGGIDGLNEAVAPTPSDSLQDAVQTSSTSDHINDAVQFDPLRDINDAVLAGANTGKGKVKRLGQGDFILALACTAGGEDLVVSNEGDAVAPGTKVKWQVSAAGETGYFLLKNGLDSGARVRVADALDFGVDAGTKCVAKAI